MKNLNDEELINLATDKLNKCSKNNNASLVLMVIILLQGFLCFIGSIHFIYLALTIVVCYGLHLYHSYKFNKEMDIVDEIIKELNEREINN